MGTRATVRKISPAMAKAQERVLKWFVENGRAFPWREHRDPYKTLVAEVMLQQTQTGRVGPSYQAFVEHFPSVSSLARAPAMDVIKAWKGLGYNRRAVNLQQAAQKIEHSFSGEVPSDPADLKQLPGVGEYSASAVACFSYDAQIPVVDVNVTRVLGRAAFASDAPDAKKLGAVALQWLPQGEAYAWNQALMDIGATLCRIDKPLCPKCPMKAACEYYAAGKHKVPAAARSPKQSPFEGSARQKRGGIIDALRESAAAGISMGALAKAVHPNGGDRDLGWLVELLSGLERDGLVALSPGARKASPRGLVRLPT
jgi:A/G-specific adenine glycosylase